MVHYSRTADELALLFTGSPAPAASKTNNTVQVVEEADDHSDSDPNHTSRTPHDASQVSSPEQTTPTLAEIQESLSSLSVGMSENTPQKAGAIHPILAHSPPSDSAHSLFSIEQLGVDRRLIVNRKRQLKMYRVWMQGKFRKL